MKTFFTVALSLISLFLFGQVTTKYRVDTLIAGLYETGAIAVSPDGKQLVFDSKIGGTRQLFLYTFETDELKQLTNEPNGSEQACFHPNGKELAFVRISDRKLCCYKLETSKISELLDRDVQAWMPQYNVAGNLLAFSGMKQHMDAIQIFTYDFKYDNLNHLTDQPTHCLYPQWSPSSELLSYVYYDQNTKTWCTTLINWYGKHYDDLHETFKNTYDLNWSLSDYKIIYVETEKADCNLVISRKDRSNREVLLRSPFTVKTPCWIPESNQIVFVTSDLAKNHYNILRIDLEEEINF
ncbi:MAG: hypothetical protein LBM67_08905 [Lentimicrobiaceae bacterium]|jgi:Tol biopolymer transport system component|nr:hypothetical protein [Lentimicrobiaceae bacterium]